MDARRTRVLAVWLTLAVAVVAASADYVVVPGDTLGNIARQLGVSTADLVAANNISNPDLIRPGQILVIPGTAASGSDSVHVVVSGETLAAIAAHYGISLQQLVSSNDISNPNLIRIGQEITVPGRAEAAPTQDSPSATYTVQAGDTLGSIAALHGTTVAAIAAANGITASSIIYVGTVLRLSGPSLPTVEPNPTSLHVVAAGESLASVAASYGTTVSALVTANSITDPNLIRVGQELEVPGGGPAWVCPVAGAHYFNDWGFPRSGGRFHEGNDLFAPRGAPVVAPVAGTLVVQNGVIGGLQFRLYGEDGTTYIGTHLESASPQGYVGAGSLIGTVGDSGNAAGSNPHLHFEMHPNDELAVNPYPVLQQYGC